MEYKMKEHEKERRGERREVFFLSFFMNKLK